MQERIDTLEAEQEDTREQLKEEKQELEQMVADARSDVKELRKILKEAKKILQRNNADLGAEMQETREEVQKLRGKIQEKQFRLQKLEQELQMFKEDVELRFSSGGVAGELPEKADELFEFAQTKFDEGDLKAARQAYEELLSRHSKDDRTDKAQMRLADIHFEQGKWVSGVVDYRKILQNYPDSDLRPTATYKIGLGFIRLGKCDQAKPFFETVDEEYSGTEQARKATAKLREIEKGTACR